MCQMLYQWWNVLFGSFLCLDVHLCLSEIQEDPVCQKNINSQEDIPRIEEGKLKRKMKFNANQMGHIST